MLVVSKATQGQEVPRSVAQDWQPGGDRQDFRQDGNGPEDEADCARVQVQEVGGWGDGYKKDLTA